MYFLIILYNMWKLNPSYKDGAFNPKFSVKKSLKVAAAKKSFLLFGSLGLHNLSNGVEEAPHPRINVIAEAEINTTQIPNASEAKFEIKKAQLALTIPKQQILEMGCRLRMSLGDRSPI